MKPPSTDTRTEERFRAMGVILAIIDGMVAFEPPPEMTGTEALAAYCGAAQTVARDAYPEFDRFERDCRRSAAAGGATTASSAGQLGI